MTEETKPLRDMVDMQTYKASRKFEWTPELARNYSGAPETRLSYTGR